MHGATCHVDDGASLHSLGCLACGVTCCAACAIDVESVAYCASCARSLLGTPVRARGPLTLY